MLNNMKVLIGLLVVIAGLAYWVTQKDQAPVPTSKALIPAWQSESSQLAEVDEVVLSKAGEQIKLSKIGKNWVLNDGFYASVDPLFKLLQGLRNAEIVEIKTANPDNHARIDLSDNDLKIVIKAADKELEALHLGKSTAGGNMFLRRVGEAQTYAVSGLSPVVFSVDSWQLKTAVDIDEKDVQAVILTPQEGEPIELARSKEANNWELNNIPTGQQLKTTAYLDQLGGTLSRFMIDDALVRNTAEMTELLQAEYTLKNGNELLLKAFQKDDDYFVTIDSAAYPQYKDWMMQIAEYKFKSFNRTLGEYIEPVTESESSEAVSESSEEPSVE